MKRLALLIPICIMIIAFAKAQSNVDAGKVFVPGPGFERCASAEVYSSQMANDPVFKAGREQTEKDVAEWIAEHPDFSPKATVTIPLVVHVIYYPADSASEYIPVSRVQDNIDETNRDWAGLSTHSIYSFPATDKVPTGVQFCLASIDPEGNPTTGVTYTRTTVSTFNCADNYPERSSSTGGCDAWDVTKYLNIWVCNMGLTLCGLSEFPSSPNNNKYGSTINYCYLGNPTDGAQAPFNLGGTLSHELGHCFDLYHTWGDADGACSGSSTVYPGSDLVDDTPIEHQATFGNSGALSPSNPDGNFNGRGQHSTTLIDSCTKTAPGVLYEDFMDYTDDIDYACFTTGQVARIQAIIAGDDASLVTSAVGCNTGIKEMELISNINIYPNPASKEIQVIGLPTGQAGNQCSVSGIEIFNLLGEKVFTLPITDYRSPASQAKRGEPITINIADFPSGVYIVAIKTPAGTINKKLSVIK
jgi:hypothetical protein